MKKLVLMILVTAPALAQIQSSDFTYKGYFQTPVQGISPHPGYTGGDNDLGLALVPDCLGYADPSPNDGYPGCLMGYLRKTADRYVGLFDIPPPAQALRATEIVFWSLFGQYPENTYPGDPFDGGLDAPYDLLYDRGDGYCRIWWNFVYYYANGMQVDTPFLGYSSCDPQNPNPQGMFAYDSNLHPNQATRSLTIIPQGIADDYFGGQQMGITMGKGSGTRGSSGGPSILVRDLDIPDGPPTTTGCCPGATTIDDYQLTLSYRANGYPCWADPQDFRITLTLDNGWVWEAPFSMCSRDSGGEFIRISGQDIYVTSVPMPVYTYDQYPYDDPGSIYHQGNLFYPDMRPDAGSTPPGRPTDEIWTAAYYGDQEVPLFVDQERCISGLDSTGTPCNPASNCSTIDMPRDAQLVAECTGGRGPHCNNMHSFLLLYDLDELKDNYDEITEVYSVTPADYIDISSVMTTICDYKWGGTTYDPVTQTMFLASGGDIRVHMWEIGEPAGPPPPASRKVSGGASSGGKVE